MPKLWAGVDGCRSGWVVVVIDSSSTVISVQVLKTFAEAAVTIGGVEGALVDIPIGLPSAECPVIRRCDAMARELLGPRASSIFAVPAREAAWAPTYAEACRRNEQILGRELSKQSWNICPKIREADAVFRLAPRLQNGIRETHPELCFRLLNNGHPMENPKKSRAGRKIRTGLLRSWIGTLDPVLKAKRPSRGCEVDDLLDALAAALVARLSVLGKAGRVPLAPERDAFGLAMEIVGV